MRNVKCILLSVLFLFVATFGVGLYGPGAMTALAGSLGLDDTGDPTIPGGGAMNTLGDIYNILNDGSTNEPRTGAFAEPSAGPAGTGHTLTEVYDRAKTSSRPASTGQTTSYSSTGGEDGDLQKGVAWPNPRFTDNTDGTVTDNLTGLIWLKQANYNSTTETTGTATWEGALAFANGLSNGECGLTDGSLDGDWRLPNIKELLSLIDWASFNPAMSNDAGTEKWTSSDGSSFTGVQSAIYWSSTTFVANTNYAWHVDLNLGLVNYYNKDYDHYVWPVRGGQ